MREEKEEGSLSEWWCGYSSTAVMDQPLPAILNQLVQEFTQHMRQQTATGDQLDKFSDSNMRRVQQETVTQREVEEGGREGVMCDVCSGGGGVAGPGPERCTESQLPQERKH